MKRKLLKFMRHGDSRGQLIALEQNHEVPFSIQRIYYIFDTSNNVRRGFHAHKSLQQILVCVNGSCKIHLDDGREQQEIFLDSPDKGILLSGVIWREMYDFSPNSVLVVLASQPYNEQDYIRNYEEFIHYIKEENIS